MEGAYRLRGLTQITHLAHAIFERVPEPDKTLSKEIVDLTGVPPELAEAEARLAQELADTWIALPFQPLRAVFALIFIAGGFGLYEYVLLSFWSSPTMGIHDRIPYPAYFGIGAAMLLALIGVRLAIGVWSPHAKLALGLLAFFACVAIGIGGGRFVSYTLRGTLNPPFTLNIKGRRSVSRCCVSRSKWRNASGAGSR